jgi:hypothetical protein
MVGLGWAGPQPRFHVFGPAMRAAEAHEQSGPPGAVHADHRFAAALRGGGGGPQSPPGPRSELAPALVRAEWDGWAPAGWRATASGTRLRDGGSGRGLRRLSSCASICATPGPAALAEEEAAAAQGSGLAWAGGDGTTGCGQAGGEGGVGGSVVLWATGQLGDGWVGSVVAEAAVVWREGGT